MKLTFIHARAVISSFLLRSPPHHVTNVLRVSPGACKDHFARPYHVSSTDRYQKNRSLTCSFLSSVSQPRVTSRVVIRTRAGFRQSEQERWISYTTQRAGHGKTSNGINSLLEERWKTETVDVPIGGNGTVELNISTPIADTTTAGEQTQLVRNVLVYLPPGPFPESVTQTSDNSMTDDNVEEHKALLDVLARAEHAHDSRENALAPIVVRINYRLSIWNGANTSRPDHRYPSPIHDVSMAFDWILENVTELCLRPATVAQSGTDQTEQMRPDDGPKISLFGSHIGGSLALMLALTQPNDIHAIAVRDPIIDWVSLDEVADSTLSDQSTKKRSKVDSDEARFLTQKAANVLINCRTQLFRNPSGFFDAFASPVLFLRAPGRDTPLWRTARPEYEDTAQDEEHLAELMKNDGDVHVDKLETDEVVSEMGYGPYDDDWHTAEYESTKQRIMFEMDKMPKASRSLELELQQLSTDLSTMTLGQVPSGRDSHQKNIEPQPRRRKVLRRWPPIGLPENTDLPWTKIYSTPPRNPASTISEQIAQISLSHVLHPQAKEMADLMRRACFWGREKSLGEERVNIEFVGPLRTGDGMGDGMREDDLLRDNDMEQEDGKFGTLLEATAWLRAMSTVEK